MSGQPLLALTVCVLILAGCGEAARTRVSTPTVRPLTIVGAPTPPLRVQGYDTRGMYPQVSDQGGDLRAVNAALKDAVLADQRAFALYARREALSPSTGRGDYRLALYGTETSRSYGSASTVVVSVLLPRMQEVFEGQPGGDGWLGITVRVPSGKRVTITDLFANPQRGIKVLASAWRTQIRRTGGASCLRLYADLYTPTVKNFAAFALTPTGIAVGTTEIAVCYRLDATVPYSAVRPYLSKLGTTLVAGVRQAR